MSPRSRIWPQLLLVVERADKIRANLLEEIRLLDALQQDDPVGFPGHLNVGELVPIQRVLIETSNAIFEQRFDGWVLRRLSVPWLDRRDVIAVDQEVVRIDVARNFHEGLQGRWCQRGRIGGPRAPDADPGAPRPPDNPNCASGPLQKDSAAILASTIDFSHGYPPLNVILIALTEAATFLDHLDLVAVGIGDEEEACERRAVMLEIAQRPGRQFFPLEARMLGIEIIDDDGEMAIAVARNVRLRSSEIHREFEFERRRFVVQVNQREIGKYEAIGNLQVKRPGVEIERPRFIENADHRMNRLGHSAQLLEIGDDGGAGFRLALADAMMAPGMTACGLVSHASSVFSSQVNPAWAR